MAITTVKPDLAFARASTRLQIMQADDLLIVPIVPLEDESRVKFELWDGTRYLFWTHVCDIYDDPAIVSLGTTSTVQFRENTLSTAVDPGNQLFWAVRALAEFPSPPAATPCVQVTWYRQNVNHLQGVLDLALPFYGKPRITSYLLAMLTEIQELSEQAYDVRYAYHIDFAIAQRLDLLGQIVGQFRLGFDQETFRALIRARAAANRSSGGYEDLIAVTSAALKGSGTVQVDTTGPGAVDIHFDGVPDFTPLAATHILPVTRAAGVGGTLTISNPSFWGSEFPDSQPF